LPIRPSWWNSRARHEVGLDDRVANPEEEEASATDVASERVEGESEASSVTMPSKGASAPRLPKTRWREAPADADLEKPTSRTIFLGPERATAQTVRSITIATASPPPRQSVANPRRSPRCSVDVGRPEPGRGQHLADGVDRGHRERFAAGATAP